MFQQLNVPGAPPAQVQAQAAQQPQQAGAPNFANLLNQMMPLVGGLLQNVQGGGRPGAGGPGAGGAAAAGGGNLADLMGNMMNQLGMGGAALIAGAGAEADAGGAASPAAAAARAQAQARANNPEGQREGVQGRNDANDGAEGARAAAGGAAAMRDVAGGDDAADEEEDEHASLFDLFLSQLMTHLALPDLLGLVSGNFSCLERLHAPFQTMLRDILEEDSAAARELLAHSFAASIVDSLDERALSAVAAQRIPGSDPRRTSAPIAKKHVRALIDLILDTPVAAAGAALTPASFSSRFKEWASGFVGEWLVELGQCYRDGLLSSQKLATALLQHKLTSMGGAGAGGLGDMAFMMPMVSASLGGVMLKCAQQYQQAALMRAGPDGKDGAAGAQRWMELVPEADRQRWASVIAADEATMARQLAERQGSAAAAGAATPSLYVPLSRAYLAGGGKRQEHKPAAAAASAPGAVGSAAASSAAAASSTQAAAAAAAPDRRISEQLERQLGRSLTHALSTAGGSAASSPSVERTVASLPPELQDAYRAQLTADLRAIVQERAGTSGFAALRFPNIEQHVMRATDKDEAKQL